MRSVRVAICDDDKKIMTIIESSIIVAFKNHDIIANTNCFSSCDEMDRFLKREGNRYDIIFLDIEMPGMDGITFGKKIKEENDSATIIYLSSREERVFDALKVGTFDFIRKSHFLKDLGVVIKRFVDEVNVRSNCSVAFKSKEGIVNVCLLDITYFEGNGKIQLMHLSKKVDPLPIYQTMETLEESFRDRGFLRVHKGFLVNHFFIAKIGVGKIELTDNTEIPLSRKKTKEIKEQFLMQLKIDNSIVF